jgi:transposase InsO family protein
MQMHKRIRLTPLNREEIWRLYSSGEWQIKALAERFLVSRPTIYKVVERARLQEFAPRKSTNKRFMGVKFGIKRLAKIESGLEDKQKRAARRYNKHYPGELVHFDCKRLKLLKGEERRLSRDYLFVAIDDYSRELYAAILPDKTQVSAAQFLAQVLEECPYTIEAAYSDNGREFKGNCAHVFAALCAKNNIRQRFTRPGNPQTNGKAERVIRTLMEMWYDQFRFTDRADRAQSLGRFVNFYNTVKPHKGIDNQTPYELLKTYFNLV